MVLKRWSLASGRSVWPFVGFLALFAGILIAVARFYLLQALRDFNSTDERGRRLISLHALLMMSILLVVLGLCLVLIFRLGRYFFPGQQTPRQKTTYVDAWAESGKRAKTPPADLPADADPE